QALAMRIHALGDLDAPTAWHQRRGQLECKIVHFVLVLAPDLQHIAETLGNDETRTRPPTLDQRVRKQRGGMHDPAHIAKGETVSLEHVAHAPDHAQYRICGRGELFMVQANAALVIIDDDVGEGAADIYAEGAAHAFSRVSSDPGATAA